MYCQKRITQTNNNTAMKKMILLFLIIPFLPIKCSGQENSILTGGKFSFSVHEKYLARKVSRVLSYEPGYLTDVTLDFKHGWYTQLWSMHGLDSDFSGDSGDETQFIIGKKFSAPNLQGLTQIGYFNIHPFEEWGSDRFCADLQLTKKIDITPNLSMSPEVWLTWLGESEDPLTGGWVARAGTSFVWKKPFDVDKLQITGFTNINVDDGVGKNKSGGMFLYSNIQLSWTVSKNFSLTLPGYTSIVSVKDPEDGRGENNGSWWVGMTAKW